MPTTFGCRARSTSCGIVVAAPSPPRADGCRRSNRCRGSSRRCRDRRSNSVSWVQMVSIVRPRPAGPREDVVAIGAEIGEIEMAVAVDQHHAAGSPLLPRSTKRGNTPSASAGPCRASDASVEGGEIAGIGRDAPTGRAARRRVRHQRLQPEPIWRTVSART